MFCITFLYLRKVMHPRFGEEDTVVLERFGCLINLKDKEN